MDIVKELTRLHELAGETTLLNFRALMQNELRKLIEQAQNEAAEHGFAGGQATDFAQEELNYAMMLDRMDGGE